MNGLAIADARKWGQSKATRKTPETCDTGGMGMSSFEEVAPDVGSTRAPLKVREQGMLWSCNPNPHVLSLVWSVLLGRAGRTLALSAHG